MITLIITAIVAILFIGISLIYFGWLPSISKIYYKLKEKKEGLQYLFTLFMWFVGIMVMYMGGKNEPNATANMFYLGGAFLLFVGAFPRFEEDEQKEHYVVAGMGLIVTLLALSNPTNYFMPILSFIVISGLIKALKFNNSIFWIEIVFICLTFGALYIKYS
jgi:hypothetical protein